MRRSEGKLLGVHYSLYQMSGETGFVNPSTDCKRSKPYQARGFTKPIWWF